MIEMLPLFFADVDTIEAGHGGGIFGDTYFWVGLGFLVLIGIIVRQAGGAIVKALDSRADKIAAQLQEARDLREEAQKRLADIERRNAEAEAEAKRIAKQAKAQAQGLLEQADKDAEALKARRTAQVEARIAQMEEQAIARVRRAAAEIAADAARKVLTDAMSGAGGQARLDQAIEEVGRRLH